MIDFRQFPRASPALPPPSFPAPRAPRDDMPPPRITSLRRFTPHRSPSHFHRSTPTSIYFFTDAHSPPKSIFDTRFLLSRRNASTRSTCRRRVSLFLPPSAAPHSPTKRPLLAAFAHPHHSHAPHAPRCHRSAPPSPPTHTPPPVPPVAALSVTSPQTTRE